MIYYAHKPRANARGLCAIDRDLGLYDYFFFAAFRFVVFFGAFFTVFFATFFVFFTAFLTVFFAFFTVFFADFLAAVRFFGAIQRAIH